MDEEVELNISTLNNLTMDSNMEAILRYVCESTDTTLNLTLHRFEAPPDPILNLVNAVKLLLTGFVFLWSVIGNSLVVALVARNSQLHTGINYYLLNLAIADLLITIVCLWSLTISDMYYDYTLGPVMCVLSPFVQGG